MARVLRYYFVLVISIFFLATCSPNSLESGAFIVLSLFKASNKLFNVILNRADSVYYKPIPLVLAS